MESIPTFSQAFSRCIFFLCLLLAFVASPENGHAQHREYWVAGGFPGSSADGAPATNARFMPWSLTTDALGNIYFVDSATRIKKIDRVSGLVTRLAGSNILTHSGDGGPAVTADVNAKGRICTDPAGNVIFTDDDFKVRKINTSTGIITTIAGASVGYSGDGGPATAASLSHPYGICTDATGNIFVCANGALRKIDAASGIITTVASGFEAVGVCVDNAGYAYVSGNNLIRKINIATGAVTIFAGTGSIYVSGDGGPATAAGISSPHDMVYNATTGKFYVICHLGSQIREIDLTTGIIRTVLGDFGSCSGSWSPVMFFYLTSDPEGNLLFSVIAENSIWKSVPFGNASISATNSQTCVGVTSHIAVDTLDTFGTSMYVESHFGDGTITPTLFTPSSSCVSATAEVSHVYQSPGVYSIKHVLKVGAAHIDSVVKSYEYKECNASTLKFYYDTDNDCIKDPGESFSKIPVLVRVDSAGIPIDTLTATAGTAYFKLGPPGTVYAFSVLPGALSVSCPATGTYSDTVGFNNYTHFFGLRCTSMPVYDLQVHAVAVCGIHFAKTTSLITNLGCASVSADAHLYNVKYPNMSVIAGPMAGSPTISPNNFFWNTLPLSAAASGGMFTIGCNATSSLLIGDIAQFQYSVSPTVADANISNNMIIVQDTVRASYDPNIINVNKQCFDDDGAQLQYTVHFENLGNDTAHNVYVMDTLSNNLDPKSLEIVATSAQMFTYQYKAGPYNIIKFDFPAIKLLDSSWHGLNEGMFVYKIKTLTSLPAGELTHAHVGIYFDNNEVVLTNTASAVKGCPLSVSEVNATHQISLFPNPATSELTIKTEPNLFTSLTIINTVGQQVLQQPMSNPQVKVSVKDLPPGIYYVTLKGEQGSEVRKFVKW